ncbi:hypothetical protein G7046_g6966 [Stylonectria norvegica]|nr:hypothetical protein G7046_g6966 [Stylonectria norvegica]
MASSPPQSDGFPQQSTGAPEASSMQADNRTASNGTKFNDFLPSGLPVLYRLLPSLAPGHVPQNDIHDKLAIGFYTKPPQHARAIFSTIDGQLGFKSLEHILPTRQIHLWSADEIQVVCNSLRNVHWKHMRSMLRPESYYDLYMYFDASDLYNYGAYNLWCVTLHMFAENKIIHEDAAKTYAILIGQWADNWITIPENRTKLVAWNSTKGPLLPIISPEDWASLGNVEDYVLPLVANALKYRRSRIVSPSKQHVLEPPMDLMTACRTQQVHNWIVARHALSENGLPPPRREDRPYIRSPMSGTRSIVYGRTNIHIAPGCFPTLPSTQPPHEPSQAVQQLQQSTATTSIPLAEQQRAPPVAAANGSSPGPAESPSSKEKSKEVLPPDTLPPPDKGDVTPRAASGIAGSDNSDEAEDAALLTPTKTKRKPEGNFRAPRLGALEPSRSLPTSTFLERAELADSPKHTNDDSQLPHSEPAQAKLEPRPKEANRSDDARNFIEQGREVMQSRANPHYARPPPTDAQSHMAVQQPQQRHDTAHRGPRDPAFGGSAEAMQGYPTDSAPRGYPPNMAPRAYIPYGTPSNGPDPSNASGPSGFDRQPHYHNMPPQQLANTGHRSEYSLSNQQAHLLDSFGKPMPNENQLRNRNDPPTTPSRGGGKRRSTSHSNKRCHRGSYGYKNGSMQSSQQHAQPRHAPRGQEPVQWDSIGQQPDIGFEQASSTTGQPFCPNSHDFTAKDYTHCICPSCNGRNRSVLVSILQDFNQEAAPTCLLTRLRIGLAGRFGIVETVTRTSSPHQFVVRFNTEDIALAALNVSNVHLPEQLCAVKIVPVFRSKWVLFHARNGSGLSSFGPAAYSYRSDQYPQYAADNQQRGQHYPNAPGGKQVASLPPRPLEPNLPYTYPNSINQNRFPPHQPPPTPGSGLPPLPPPPHNVKQSHGVSRNKKPKELRGLGISGMPVDNAPVVVVSHLENAQTKPSALEVFGITRPEYGVTPSSPGSKASTVKARVSLPNTPRKSHSVHAQNEPPLPKQHFDNDKPTGRNDKPAVRNGKPAAKNHKTAARNEKLAVENRVYTSQDVRSAKEDRQSIREGKRPVRGEGPASQHVVQAPKKEKLAFKDSKRPIKDGKDTAEETAVSSHKDKGKAPANTSEVKTESGKSSGVEAVISVNQPVNETAKLTAKGEKLPVPSDQSRTSPNEAVVVTDKVEGGVGNQTASEDTLKPGSHATKQAKITTKGAKIVPDEKKSATDDKTVPDQKKSAKGDEIAPKQEKKIAKDDKSNIPEVDTSTTSGAKAPVLETKIDTEPSHQKWADAVIGSKGEGMASTDATSTTTKKTDDEPRKYGSGSLRLKGKHRYMPLSLADKVESKPRYEKGLEATTQHRRSPSASANKFDDKSSHPAKIEAKAKPSGRAWATTSENADSGPSRPTVMSASNAPGKPSTSNDKPSISNNKSPVFKEKRRVSSEKPPISNEKRRVSNEKPPSSSKMADSGPSQQKDTSKHTRVRSKFSKQEIQARKESWARISMPLDPRKPQVPSPAKVDKAEDKGATRAVQDEKAKNSDAESVKSSASVWEEFPEEPKWSSVKGKGKQVAGPEFKDSSSRPSSSLPHLQAKRAPYSPNVFDLLDTGEQPSDSDEANTPEEAKKGSSSNQEKGKQEAPASEARQDERPESAEPLPSSPSAAKAPEPQVTAQSENVEPQAQASKTKAKKKKNKKGKQAVGSQQQSPSVGFSPSQTSIASRAPSVDQVPADLKKDSIPIRPKPADVSAEAKDDKPRRTTSPSPAKKARVGSSQQPRAESTKGNRQTSNDETVASSSKPKYLVATADLFIANEDDIRFMTGQDGRLGRIPYRHDAGGSLQMRKNRRGSTRFLRPNASKLDLVEAEADHGDLSGEFDFECSTGEATLMYYGEEEFMASSKGKDFFTMSRSPSISPPRSPSLSFCPPLEPIGSTGEATISFYGEPPDEVVMNIGRGDDVDYLSPSSSPSCSVLTPSTRRNSEVPDMPDSPENGGLSKHARAAEDEDNDTSHTLGASDRSDSKSFEPSKNPLRPREDSGERETSSREPAESHSPKSPEQSPKGKGKMYSTDEPVKTPSPTSQSPQAKGKQPITDEGEASQPKDGNSSQNP